jgi:hypothetical protein
MKQKISSLDDLNRLISDENITKELKLKVFLEALRGYPVRVMTVFLDRGKNLVHDPHNMLVPNMQRVISEILADGNKEFYSGFMIILK